MKVELKGRSIPRNTAGDPAFTQLYSIPDDPAGPPNPQGVLTVFTPAEVVELVNRAVYQLEYQHNAHKVRAQRQRDSEKPVKQMVRKLFGVPWSKATEEQIVAAVKEIAKGQTT